VDKGHKLLAARGVATLFVSAKGLPHSKGTWSKAWKEGVLQSAGAPASFPYHRLRHIFVEDRLENPGQVSFRGWMLWCEAGSSRALVCYWRLERAVRV